MEEMPLEKFQQLSLEDSSSTGKLAKEGGSE